MFNRELIYLEKKPGIKENLFKAISLLVMVLYSIVINTLFNESPINIFYFGAINLFFILLLVLVLFKLWQIDMNYFEKVANMETVDLMNDFQFRKYICIVLQEQGYNARLASNNDNTCADIAISKTTDVCFVKTVHGSKKITYFRMRQILKELKPDKIKVCALVTNAKITDSAELLCRFHRIKSVTRSELIESLGVMTLKGANIKPEKIFFLEDIYYYQKPVEKRHRRSFFKILAPVLLFGLLVSAFGGEWLQSATETRQTQKTQQAQQTNQTTYQYQMDEQFDRQTAELIKQQLSDFKRHVVLDDLFRKYRINESETDQLVDRVLKNFQQVLNQNPDFFYLTGAAGIEYSRQTVPNARIIAMTLTPQYHTFAHELADDELRDISYQVDQVTADIARRIREQTDDPWQQLRIAHQYLIRTIEYDETKNQDHNHAASALLDGKSLCQGYAQAFAAIGRQLGHDVLMITGEVEGQGHAWNLVRLDGQVYHVDVTHDDPVPDRGPDHPVRHMHFMRSDQIMRETHAWQADLFPAAKQDGAHYYRQTGRVAESPEIARQLISTQLSQHDFSDKPTFFLEFLFSGSETLQRQYIETAVQEGIWQNQPSGQASYSFSQAKSIVIIEVLTD